MKALRIYAGIRARARLEQEGLQPQQVRVIPAAAGGPKGLVLGPLDRFIFGDWLDRSQQPIHLIGASIGAWRMATACLNDPNSALLQLETAYIHQRYEVQHGQKRPSPAQVSAVFGENLRHFYQGQVSGLLKHARFSLHIVTSRGRHLLNREHALRTPAGYVGAFLANAVSRKVMGGWLERVVFSSQGTSLPFRTTDYASRQVALNDDNFYAALQASCSIPFVLNAVHDIPGAPAGAYWDGGITDYHLHLDYRQSCAQGGIVLYPHFQQHIIPGWLDKALAWRHRPSRFLDDVLVLAPDPGWVAGALPHGKLPDRTDFGRYGNDFNARVVCWKRAVLESERLRDEFVAWLDKPDLSQIRAL